VLAAAQYWVVKQGESADLVFTRDFLTAVADLNKRHIEVVNTVGQGIRFSHKLLNVSTELI
jgi:uncharacterized protein YaiI (UPF0178 family)